MKLSVRFGLVSGLAIVLVTLVAVAIINLPKAKGAEPDGARSDVTCPLVQVAQDQGYGVTRTLMRHVCGLPGKR